MARYFMFTFIIRRGFICILLCFESVTFLLFYFPGMLIFRGLFSFPGGGILFYPWNFEEYLLGGLGLASNFDTVFCLIF